MGRMSQGIVLAVLGTAFAVPYFQNRNVQPLSRNRYNDLDNCLLDYSMDQCKVDGGHWYGPWYMAASNGQATAYDPGPGRYFYSHGWGSRSGSSDYGSNFGPGYGSGIASSTVATRGGGPIVESGYRDGFGGTARLGRVGS